MTEKTGGAGATGSRAARTLAAAAALTLVAAGLAVMPSAASAAPAMDVLTTTPAAVVRPDGPLPPSSITAERMAELNERHLELRERVALAQPVPLGAAPSAGATGVARVEPTGVTGGVSTQSLLVRRNSRNTRATAVSNTLAEPAAANDGNAVFYTGNTYASSSTNNGATWANVSLPGGPADARNRCCDLDVIRAHSRDRIFSSLLYTNGAGNGVVRIFVRSSPTAAPLCSYTIDPGGTANNVLPDFPHLGLSRNALYLSTNNIRGGSWIGSQMHRLDLAQMSACQPATRQVATYNPGFQRVFVPIEGMQNRTEMIFAAIESVAALRIFRWPEGSSNISMTVRLVNGTSFSRADCRGGTGNHDFFGGNATLAVGFSVVGTLHGSRVTWFWNSAPVGNKPQAHVRAASFRLSDLRLMEQPDIWNAGFCFGFPAVSGNVFGDIGISLASGGRRGGGGTAARGFVGVDDTPNGAIHFGSVALTASGTHNRVGGRYGDYFTVRTNARCQFAYVGTNYSLLNGNTSSSHVNARYVEFGSTLDSGCF